MSEHDARDLPEGAVIRADVCIVGAGPAGIAMALELAGSGARIVMLESGGTDFDPETQDLYAGGNLGEEYFPLDTTRLRYFGGTTNHWEGYCRPLDRRDLTWDPGPGLPGWPLDESDLSAHYERVHELCELGPVDYRPQRWAQETGNELLPLDGGTVINGVYRRSPPTRFGPRYREQLRDAAGVDIYLHANVVDVLTRGTRARGVRIAHFDGATQTVEAPTVVLATGGIENPRLLLCSNDEQGRQLGNGSDLVGRCFMEHPHVTAGYVLADADVDLSFYTDDLPVAEGFARGIFTLPEAVRDVRGLGNIAGLLHKPSTIDAEQMVGLPGIAGVRKLQGLFAGERTTAYRFNLIGEQIPNLASRVRLSEGRRDALGMQRVDLQWELEPQDLQTIRVGAELIAAAIGSAGVGRVHSLLHGSRPDFPMRGGNHHMGTTRMSEDPAAGVVDPDGQVHGVEGLYVAGSSTFPTGGWANPTLTLLSLSLRLAEHLRKVG